MQSSCGRCAIESANIPELASHFLRVAGRCGKYTARAISDSALAALCEDRWPGNVLELQNVIERALLICPDEEIQATHVPAAVLRRKQITMHPPAHWSSMILSALEKADRGIFVALFGGGFAAP